MKNERVRQAMDTVTPTAGQRQRMRLELAQKTEKMELPRHTVRYVPGKRRAWLPGTAAALAVVCALGLLAGQLSPKEQLQAAYAPPIDTKTQEKALPGEFREILERYRTGIAEQWSDARCGEENISRAVSRVGSEEELGYALLDMDGDGADELLITGVENSPFYEINGIYALYTLESENPLLTWDDPLPVLCGDLSIHIQSKFNPDDDRDTRYAYDALRDGGLVPLEAVYYNPGGTAWTPWLRAAYTREGIGEKTSIREGEFQAVLNAHPPASFTYVPLSQLPAGETEAEALAEYGAVLNTYLLAINRDWNGELCAEADISLLVRDVPTTGDLGYALRDLDGNGTYELLITDGNVIYDLYARSAQGQVQHLLTGWERNAYFLSENGVIINRGSGSASFSFVYYYRIQGTALVRVEALVEDYAANPEAPWYREDVSTGEMLPMNEADYSAAVEKYPKLPIGHTPLSTLEEESVS